ncbi:family 43 glycosylhydrolase [Actinomyces culturomici]|uniref:family 43 glycosylhydrolase n=1 Tax=Actinomyces culturomici TaxID=1926276 RepID=UPI000E203390|nr:family 43 glycosylhydrolase [Actinomyces culturomici]
MTTPPLANPVLPEGVYIPDVEPRVFGDRLYLYGSHDRYGGPDFCMENYEVWSAPLDDLSVWTNHGVSYRRDQDPVNNDVQPGQALRRLYAPDVVRVPDGRYALFYCMDDYPLMGVATAERPEGPFDFLGYIRHSDGTPLGEGEGDVLPFDPGVLVDDGRVYVYSGNGPVNAAHRRFDTVRHHSHVFELGADLTTIIDGPHPLLPDVSESGGTGFEGHEFFEASSPRRIGDLYYLVYSDIHWHALAHATATSPLGPFHYRGVLVSNGDIGVDRRKGPLQAAMPIGNDHGGLVELGGRWFLFYHRHTGGIMASRQTCAEPLELLPDGSFARARLSSTGLRGRPFDGRGTFRAHWACRLTHRWNGSFYSVKGTGFLPSIRQAGAGERLHQYVANLRDGCTAGYRSFRGLAPTISVVARASGRGRLEVSTEDGRRLASVPIAPSRRWRRTASVVLDLSGIDEADEVALLLTYRGRGRLDLDSFTLE